MATDTEPIALPELEAVFGSAGRPMPGEAFKPTDPHDEASAQLPTGLTGVFPEDTAGVEEEQPLSARTTEAPIVCIDAGVVRLGNTASGVVGAVRASAVVRWSDGRCELRTYRPGYFYLSSLNRLTAFHQMGIAFGKEDFFVKVADGRPVEEKFVLGPHDHRLLDRVRNFAERSIQRDLIEEFEGAIILFDGALTLRTYDTPARYLRRLHETCQDRDTTLIGISKKTGLTVQGVDIRLLLDREGGLPGKRKLTSAFRRNGAGRSDKRHLGDLYVVRFSPGGDTYRVDAAPAPGLTSAAAIDELAGGCLFRQGYPEPLVQSHAFSYMPPAVVVELQANAVVDYELDVKPEPRLGPVFAPFGGRWK